MLNNPHANFRSFWGTSYRVDIDLVRRQRNEQKAINCDLQQFIGKMTTTRFFFTAATAYAATLCLQPLKVKVFMSVPGSMWEARVFVVCY